MLLRSAFRARRAWLRMAAAVYFYLAISTSLTYGQADSKPSSSRPETWRGVHVMAWGLAGGPEGLAPLSEAVEKVLAPLGVNVIVLEVGYNYEFKSHPELRQTKFITHADARDLAKSCRTHGIRVIPQFNCLGHQGTGRTAR